MANPNTTAIDLGTGLAQPLHLQPRLRPLSSSKLSNLSPATRSDLMMESSSDTPTKLKRLSLLPTPNSRHGSLDLDRGGEENRGESSKHGGPSTPRGRRLGMRSSISYSPAGGPRTSLEETLKGASGVSVRGVEYKVEREKEKKKGQTLTEKHGELLTLIAQKERRVNELKQELATQEASLATLKSRWTSIIARSTTPRLSHNPTSSKPQSLPPLTSREEVSSPTSTLSAVSESPEASPARPEWAYLPPHLHQDESVWNSLLSNTIGMGGLGLPNGEGVQSAQAGAAQALAEGKKIWGKLVETVAGASGTQPSDSVSLGTEQSGAREGMTSPSGVSKIDLSSLRGILPWSTTPLSPTQSAPPRLPSNSTRLPTLPSTSSVTSSNRSSKPHLAGMMPKQSGGFDDLLGDDPTDYSTRPMMPTSRVVCSSSSTGGMSESGSSVSSGGEDGDTGGWGWL